MNKIEKLEKQKLEIENKIKKLKEKEESKDFIEIENFRIDKWSKPVKDFPIPKGYRLSEEREFIDLSDSGFKIEKYPVVYFTKNRSKLNIKNGWELSGVYMNWNGALNSNNDNLANSSGNGRVVCIKVGKNEKRIKNKTRRNK